MDAIADGTYEQVGTFNGNPLSMAAARATLLEALTPGRVRPPRRALRNRLVTGHHQGAARTRSSRGRSSPSAPRAA